jgi:hypothetical protein
MAGIFVAAVVGLVVMAVSVGLGGLALAGVRLFFRWNLADVSEVAGPKENRNEKPERLGSYPRPPLLPATETRA